MIPFLQTVVPMSRGRVIYRVLSAQGIEQRLGRQLSPHFAAAESDDGWLLTHLPSGRLIGPGARTLSELRVVVQRLEALTDWSRYTDHRLPGHTIARRLAKEFGWTMQRVG